jgi:hypothetical protein
MLDIDKGSPYHPNQDPLAIPRLLTTLEPLGLVSGLILQSSHSGGIHLYFPFEQTQASWKVGLVISTLLESAGFKVYPGQLEVFPNSRSYLTENPLSLFNGHRLPLQIGSYLLNSEFQPLSYSPDRFVAQWQHAIHRNDLKKTQLDRLTKQFQRRCFSISGKADKFLNDLNAEIELGWTGQGQTNRLLGRITMRTYIFHHVLNGGNPLKGDQLIKQVTKIAQALPGYTDWCQHQHEIYDRAEEWVRSIEKSHYFPYGTNLEQNKTPEKKINTWNQEKLKSTRSRIQAAIADLLNKASLPSKPTERFKILTNYGIGGGSLYRHKDLWHPEFMYLENQMDKLPTSLLDDSVGNELPSSDLSDHITEEIDRPGCNPLPTAFLPINIDPICWTEVQQAAEAVQRPVNISTKQLDRMRRYLKSNDPILLAEALAWLGQIGLSPEAVLAVPETEPDLGNIYENYSLSVAFNLEDDYA